MVCTAAAERIILDDPMRVMKIRRYFAKLRRVPVEKVWSVCREKEVSFPYEIRFPG